MRDIDTLAGDPRFKDLVWEALELHARKQSDYGQDDDPLANVRASEGFGIPAWVGCAIRANDKMRRLMTFAKKGELANESVRDSMLDLAVYAFIMAVLYDEDCLAAARLPDALDEFDAAGVCCDDPPYCADADAYDLERAQAQDPEARSYYDVTRDQLRRVLWDIVEEDVDAYDRRNARTLTGHLARGF